MNYWKLLALVGVLATSLLHTPQARAQQVNEVPGHLMIDLGVNFLQGNPNQIDVRPIGSRAWSLSYLYPFRLKEDSHWSFNAGVGLSQDVFQFQEDVLPLYDTASINPTGALMFDTVGNVLPASNVSKSQITARYVNLPIEVRWELNPDYKRKNFWVAVGGSVGYRFDAMSKVVYTQGTETIKLKRKENFRLNQLRYGAQIRAGISWFSIYGRYEISPLWAPNQGPSGSGWQVGMSFDLF